MSEYKYNHRCTGCDGSYADCRRLWPEQRVCCPDCDHHKAHPPAGSWRDFAEPEPEKGAPFDEELSPVWGHDDQMEAGYA